jgi:hypothetical protein
MPATEAEPKVDASPLKTGKGTRGEAWGRGVWGEDVFSIQSNLAKHMQLGTEVDSQMVDTQGLRPRTPEPLRGYWFPTNRSTSECRR